MTVFCGPSAGRASRRWRSTRSTPRASGATSRSLSSYARQFLGQVQKPKVEHVTGLSPAISIEQKTTSKSPRSTVGTVTEVYDYLRILYARLGQPHCPTCGDAVGTQTADEIIDKVLSLPEGTKLYIMAPLERKGQEKYETLLDEIRRAGFVRMRVDGKSLQRRRAAGHRPPPQAPRRGRRRSQRREARHAHPDRRGGRAGARPRPRRDAHRLRRTPTRTSRSGRSSATASTSRASSCGRSFEPLNPHHFSFNSPLGWCPTCEGLGIQHGANATLLIRDTALSLRDGAVAAWPSLAAGSRVAAVRGGARAARRVLARHAVRRARRRRTSGRSCTAPARRGCRFGPRRGVGRETQAKPAARPGLRAAPSSSTRGCSPPSTRRRACQFVYRQRLEHLVDEVPCSACHGSRLRPDAAATRFAGLTLGELCAKPLGDTLATVRRPEAVEGRAAGRRRGAPRDRATG